MLFAMNFSYLRIYKVNLLVLLLVCGVLLLWRFDDRVHDTETVKVSKLASWRLVNRNTPPSNKSTDGKPLQYFKQVRGSDVFFLSAIANTERPYKSHTNVIISAMDGANIPLMCCIIVAGDKLLTSPTRLFSEHHHIDFLPAITEYFDPAHFIAKQFLCDLPGVVQVKNISLTTSSTCSDDVGDYIPVIYPETVSGGLAICAKTAFSKGPDPERFIEWVEIQRLLGVDKILLFEIDVPEKILNIFRYYEKQGILDLVRYELPGRIKGIPGRGMDIDKRLFPQFSHDENLPVYECRERLAGYTYVAGIDMDEVILPRKNQNLKQFMQEHLSKFEDAAGFMFHVQFHLTSWGKHESHNDIFFLEYQRSTKPRWECEKYIYLPQRTHLTHTHWFEPKSGYNSYKLPPNVAVIHHYRQCPFGWKSCFPEIIIDKEMMRISSLLEQRVEKVRKDLGWK